MQPVLTIAVGLLTGAACAHYARAQGRNPWRWFWIGFLFGVFGLLCIFIMPRMKKQIRQPAAPTTEPLPPQLPMPIPHSDRPWYYLDEENNRYGPMSYSALQQAVEEKKISAETFVWNETFEDWKPLGKV